MAREAKEKQDLEKRQKMEREREEKAKLALLMQEKQREEIEKKRLAQLQRAQEKEERRKLEEQLKLQKLQEQEEAERLLAAQRRREQEAERRKEAEVRAQQQAAAEAVRQKHQMLTAQAKVNILLNKIVQFSVSVITIVTYPLFKFLFYSINKPIISIKVQTIMYWTVNLMMTNQMTKTVQNMRYHIGRSVCIF